MKRRKSSLASCTLKNILSTKRKIIPNTRLYRKSFQVDEPKETPLPKKKKQKKSKKTQKKKSKKTIIGVILFQIFLYSH